ncbi:nucleotidyltransferase [Natrinema pellirubrum DSM 15624]|uniref:Nucleotidyltransferase n=1 Tax=Natrinema pellirubrum (strain DSM 15624 / CIP 106293 / JCM 10476 / NCIMB 786 / 157) TaxID=797303 RepID=L0JRP9_NATP1|nr:nucleotidyltransferase domain-containing protein [Natrinema pellirubrum]AGB33282.1 putative nucleotidyltransferase [Natrinema pellirubrum DSM 15624]ELY71649.1 nucleotidyltransferase [Natrinema pellirubrum DSM 15624]
MTTVSAAVRTTVDDHLTTIERDRDVAIPLAVARGSHAWGAASPDSDYDVGFVFVPTDLRRYAHLEGPPETVVEEYGEFEYQGWDARTFARLLADSNDGAIDLLRSPIRYRTAFDPAALRAYVERTYNPMDLYHAWRGIATSNYRKYLSHHLVRSDDELFPILEARDGEYLVETDDGTTTVAADDDRFRETQTKPTVKRNLTITRAAMAARYLKTTGDQGDHDLPALEFESFLTEQAPAVFDADRIERARDLLERKRAGEGGERVGDAVGRSFAQPPREIDPDVHARAGPDPARLDGFVDDLIAAVR